MKVCLAIATLIAIFVMAGAQSSALTGTCASIGFRNMCCHKTNSSSKNCMATNHGDRAPPCSCSQDCHHLENCCGDANCPRGIIAIATNIIMLLNRT